MYVKLTCQHHVEQIRFGRAVVFLVVLITSYTPAEAKLDFVAQKDFDRDNHFNTGTLVLQCIFPMLIFNRGDSKLCFGEVQLKLLLSLNEGETVRFFCEIRIN